VLLLDLSGEQIGSGVILAAARGGYWIATNRHVVADQALACVVAGGQTSAAAAVVLTADRANPLGGEDLALLWLPIPPSSALLVAEQSGPVADAVELPLVVATGYSTPLQQKSKQPEYTEDDGLLLPLLSQPLLGGFALAYTSAVQKGMSGGGLFQGRKLIGINGAHSHPLWPGQWMDQTNRPVSNQLNQKLEQVSLGIPVQTIMQRLKNAAVPKILPQNAPTLCQKTAAKDEGTQRF
jgi:hypothetical protein